MKASAVKCWCASAGGCDRSTAEHLVSKALFPKRKLSVQGFDWCKDEPKVIGIKGMVSHILCEKHNNLLSDCDNEAVKAVSLFERSLAAPAPGSPAIDRNVDGHLLERWLLKTAINISIGSRWHIGVGMAGSEPGRASEYLVQVALGKLNFSAQLGAYFLFPKAESLHSPSEILILPLVRGDEIGGFYFELRSQPIFLNLFPGHFPETLGSVASIPLAQVLLDAPLVYRPPMVATAVGNLPTGMVRFRWDGGMQG